MAETTTLPTIWEVPDDLWAFITPYWPNTIRPQNWSQAH